MEYTNRYTKGIVRELWNYLIRAARVSDYKLKVVWKRRHGDSADGKISYGISKKFPETVFS